MVICSIVLFHAICILHAESTATTTSLTSGDVPIYTCNGTEHSFDAECRLLRPDYICPSVAAVNCTEGISCPDILYIWCSKICLILCAVITRCFSEGSFRLVNETRDYSVDGSTMVTGGRIEVCSNSSYKSLCSLYWDPIDAQVFCRDFLKYRAPFNSNISKKSSLLQVI